MPGAQEGDGSFSGHEALSGSSVLAIKGTVPQSVRAAGEGAYLYGESVVALLGLAPTDPTRIVVASPRRVRRNIGDNVVLLGMRDREPTTYYEGVSCQRTAAAIRAAVPRIGAGRALDAVDAALEEGYVTKEERDVLRGEIA